MYMHKLNTNNTETRYYNTKHKNFFASKEITKQKRTEKKVVGEKI